MSRAKPTAFRYSYTAFLCHFRLFNTAVARPTLLLASSGAPLRASFRSKLCSIDRRPLSRFFSSALNRTITVSCAGLSREKPDALLHGRLPSFEGAGANVAREFVEGESIMDDVKWKRVEQLDGLPQELVELHEELQDALASKSEVSIAQGENARVEHLGHGVYAQHNVMALDRDSLKGSPCTITREESRSCVRHALDALQSEFAVCVTGQPGIGKTRGSMMYAIQCLLSRQAAVLYVGFKSREMLLFLPREDGTYAVWSAKSSSFDQTRFQGDARVVAVIDPPEDGPYSSMGKCRVLKFVSNNAEKHFRNWEKDGILLVTSMPTDREVLAMTRVLWDEERSPHPWQHDEFNTLEEKQAEVEKRIELVGAIPRLVFASELFELAIRGCLQGAEVSTESISDSDLYKALRGKYRPLLEKHPASASSRVFFLSPKTLTFRTWKERARHPAAFQLSPIATLVLRDRLEDCIEVLRKDKFEDYAFDWLCEKQGRKAEIQYVSDADHSTAYQRIASMDEEELRVYRPAASNFPFIDFATSKTTWYNAKSIGKEIKTVQINEGGARKFLDNLERVLLDKYSCDEVQGILRHSKPVLTAITNRDAQIRFRDSKAALDFFGHPVILRVENVSDMSLAGNMLERINRTTTLLDDFQRQQSIDLG